MATSFSALNNLYSDEQSGLIKQTARIGNSD